MVNAAAFQRNGRQECHAIIRHAAATRFQQIYQKPGCPQIGNVQLQPLDWGQNMEDLLGANGGGLRIVMQGQRGLFQIWNDAQCPTHLGNVWDWTMYGECDVDAFQCLSIHLKDITQHRGDASVVAQCIQFQSLQWTALVQRSKQSGHMVSAHPFGIHRQLLQLVAFLKLQGDAQLGPNHIQGDVPHRWWHPQRNIHHGIGQLQIAMVQHVG